MTEQDSAAVPSSSFVVIGDKLEPKEYLQNLVALVKKENGSLPDDQQIQYLVCDNYTEIALALRDHPDEIKMMLVGPGIDGKQETVARLLSQHTKVVLVVDPILAERVKKGVQERRGMPPRSDRRGVPTRHRGRARRHARRDGCSPNAL